MKSFRNANPKDLNEAVRLLNATPNSAAVGGGSDLLGMVKERILTPDVLVNLKSVASVAGVKASNSELRIGGLTTLDTIAHDSAVLQRLPVLAEAAGSVATPQIRNVGTIAGNLMQRPWCWYYRNGFKCYKAGGNTCYSVTGENEFHAIFGGGPSFIVHPSDTAPALVALDAKFRIVGPSGERTVNAADFFQLPKVDASKETVLNHGEVLAEIIVPMPANGTRSMYRKELDRESWTHAIVSVAAVLDMNGNTCRSARVVMGGVAPIPWRLQKVEQMLAGQRITPQLLDQVASASVEGAQPLAKNGYKIPLTKAVVRQTIERLAQA